MPPPQVRVCFTSSLNLALKFALSVWSLLESSLFTLVRHTTAAVFLCASAPSRALFLTMQYGISFFLHSAGRHTTSSIGFTSFAMQTIFALPSSMRCVTCFSPNLSTAGALSGSAEPFLAAASAMSLMRAFLSAADSGRYLLSSLKSSVAWFLSSVLVNWLIDGGTLSRSYRILRWRCMRMYAGHLTKRERSRPCGCGDASDGEGETGGRA